MIKRSKTRIKLARTFQSSSQYAEFVQFAGLNQNIIIISIDQFSNYYKFVACTYSR